MNFYALSYYKNELKKEKLLIEEKQYSNNKLYEEKKDTIIEYITYDSKKVKKNTLFICKGAAFKKEYLLSAKEKGAACYVSEKDYDIDLPCLLVKDIRKAMPYLASEFFNYPQKEITITGITGTKGKSTTACYIKAILDLYLKEKENKDTALISSINTYDGKADFESHITTPESVELIEHIRNAVDKGLPYLTMEASSQALKYDRVDLVEFTVGLFLNISEDHISPIEHPTFEDYFHSKLKIFERTKNAVINHDADYFDEIKEAAQKSDKVENIIVFGTDKSCDLYCHDIKKIDGAIEFYVKTKNFDEKFDITMPGLFNVENALAAIATSLIYKIPLDYIKRGLHIARSKGRMELFSTKDKKLFVLVDYAHNKLSFEKLFGSVKEEYKDREIISIFGCPGKKAYKRRTELGEIASIYSKKIYIVAEDPGEEKYADIASEMEKHITCDYEKIEDRKEAIRKAIFSIRNKTIILVTGKGDETRQKYGRKYLPYPSDSSIVKEAIKEYDELYC